ncbi:hypothetical protein J0S82_003280, partial [Galemys pyrenaicus]
KTITLKIEPLGTTEYVKVNPCRLASLSSTGRWTYFDCNIQESTLHLVLRLGVVFIGSAPRMKWCWNFHGQPFGQTILFQMFSELVFQQTRR